MTRLKSSRIELRIEPAKKAAWQRYADAEGVSLSTFLERAADLCIEWRQKQRELRAIYPNRPDLRKGPWDTL